MFELSELSHVVIPSDEKNCRNYFFFSDLGSPCPPSKLWLSNFCKFPHYLINHPTAYSAYLHMYANIPPR